MPAGILVIVLGVAVGTLFQTIIGLLAFWFEEVNPFWWIIQKLVFIVGGLFLPLDFYPEWLQGIARSLPFAFAAYWPASTWANFSWQRFGTTVSGQLIYIAGLSLLAAVLFRTAVRRLHVQGG
jgi:ABC-2 type transport system permease protein